MRRATRLTLICSLMLTLGAWRCAAQEELNPAGPTRYGRQTLAPGFAPDPLMVDALSGGDVDVKSLALGYNCLGYAASDPDYVVEIAAPLDRLTILIASQADTTLVVNLPNGSWSCNDDTNGVNPALVFFSAAAGAYQIWIGSYAAATHDDAVLYVSSAGPEALPTTATGPDPARAPLYGEVELAPGFQPAPFTRQLIAGGHSQVADFVAGEDCAGWVSEAPDLSVYVSEGILDLWFAIRSPADTTLLVNGADGGWHCSDDHTGTNPGIGFGFAGAGLYDVWIGSAEERNYAAAILTVTEYEPDNSLSLMIDTDCPGALPIDVQVGDAVVVTRPGGFPAMSRPRPLRR